MAAIDELDLDEVEICARCRFWQFDHRPKHNFAVGECRRHAPIPMSYVMTMIASFTGETGWAVNTMANVEMDPKEEETLDRGAEGTEQFEVHQWPIVQANDWCGDFDKRTTKVQLDIGRPDRNNRMNAAEKWEKDVGLNDTGPWVGQAFSNEVK